MGLWIMREDEWEIVSQEGVSQVVPFPWDVFTDEGELVCAFQEAETPYHVHCIVISTMAGSDDVDYCHTIA